MRVRTVGFVLLVDSTQQQREMYALALKHAGYSVLQAATGTQGYQLALEERVFVVVAAVGVADQGCGWPFIRTLRHDSRTAHLPLVVLASADVIRDVEEAALGVAAVFVTPLLPNKLLETLRRLNPCGRAELLRDRSADARAMD
jgi:DNA-binding response OmpR family regulator